MVEISSDTLVSAPVVTALILGCIALLPLAIAVRSSSVGSLRRREHPPPPVGRRSPQTAEDHGLRGVASPTEARWLTAAFDSLTARPIWEGEEAAHPLLARLTDAALEVDLSAADPMAAPMPWLDVGAGRRWRLPRSTPLGRLPAAEREHLMPALVVAGDGLLLNIEGLGLLTIDGSSDTAMDVVRGMVSQLIGLGRLGRLELRSTFAITGLGSHGVTRRVSPAELMAEVPSLLDDVEGRLERRSAATVYAHRLATDDAMPPIVVITDPVGARDMPTILEAGAQRRLPLAILIVGGCAEPGEAAIVLNEAKRATLEPWGIEFVPRRQRARGGRRLAELSDGCSPRQHQRRPRTPVAVPTHRHSHSHSRSTTPVSAHARGDDADRRDHRVRQHSRRQHSRRPHERRPAIAIGPEPAEWPHGPEHNTRSSIPSEQRSTPSDETTDPLISVLGPIEITGLDQELTSQQLSLLTFLACHPATTRDAIVEAIWDGQTISKSRFPNLLAETRSRVGRHRLPEANEGRYRLVGIDVDLHRFERAVDEAASQPLDNSRALLRSALELVRGVPFTAPAPRFWAWVGNDGHVAARVESMVADAATRLARVEQDAGALDDARWACERGLAASPADETLVTILAGVYISLGKQALATRLVESWEALLNRLGCEPSDEPRRQLSNTKGRELTQDSET